MKSFFLTIGIIASSLLGCTQTANQQKQIQRDTTTMKLNELTPEEQYVILNKGTEAPFTGKYNNHDVNGVYSCKQCNTPLYLSEDKFKSHCGWPSFDDEIEGAVKRVLDADGRRTEIVCANCGGHLGHVFIGEGYTNKNTRHCVNSISLKFTPAGEEKSTTTDTAIFAGGCFWGVEYYLQKEAGVISAESGYIGDDIDNPSYELVCSKTTKFVEAVRVVFDPSITSYETLAKVFFETHDPTQKNGQGPDIGPQYISVVYYNSEEQKTIAEKLIGQLRDNGYDVATLLQASMKFWPAEGYHQDYYDRKGSTPYCHGYTKRF